LRWDRRPPCAVLGGIPIPAWRYTSRRGRRSYQDVSRLKALLPGRAAGQNTSRLKALVPGSGAGPKPIASGEATTRRPLIALD
jgi:hypothetical protein